MVFPDSHVKQLNPTFFFFFFFSIFRIWMIGSSGHWPLSKEWQKMMSPVDLLAYAWHKWGSRMWRDGTTEAETIVMWLMDSRSPWAKEWVYVKTNWTSRVSESAITAIEWETRHKNSEKSEDQGTNTAPRWRCRNWIQDSFVILSAVNEIICGELNYNSCGLQGQIKKMIINHWVIRKQ